MSKKNETAIVTANQPTSINSFFGNINFDVLNAAITNLANRGSLTDVEKESAREIIDTWQENVVEKLKLESEKIRTFLDYLNGIGYGRTLANLIESQMYSDEIEFLIDKVGKRSAYEALLDAMDEYSAATAIANTPTRLVIDVTTTVEDEILQKKDIELEQIRNEAALTKIGNKIAKLSREILTAINSDKEVLACLRALKKQETVLRKATTTCVDKAQLAKINVTIDDNNVRESLAELIEFKI